MTFSCLKTAIYHEDWIPGEKIPWGGHTLTEVTGGGSNTTLQRSLPRAIQQSHFWHPREDTIPHFDSPRVDKLKNL